MKKRRLKRKRFPETKRPGFLLGFIDFCTAGVFFLVYMKLGLLEEIEKVLGHRVQPYWMAYLLGIPTLFFYPLFWMAGISEEMRKKAIDLNIPKPHTSWNHMVFWNTFGILLMGPAVATKRFFDTLYKVERELNRREKRKLQQ